MGIILFIFIFIVVFLILSVLVSWFVLSGANHTSKRLKSGEEYTSENRQYTFPKLEIRGNGNYLLKDAVVGSIRDLVVAAHRMFEEKKIDCWLTGGSLLGVERHESIPMPYDDDADMAVSVEHREFLYSPDFQALCTKHGVKAVYLLGQNSKYADKNGSAVRLQPLDEDVHLTTLDIFFWAEDDGKIFKLDGWSGDSLYYSTKEIFQKNDVFPLQCKVKVDDLEVNLPNRPLKLLKQQYGDDVMNVAYTRSLLISHAFPFRFLSAFFVKKA